MKIDVEIADETFGGAWNGFLTTVASRVESQGELPYAVSIHHAHRWEWRTILSAVFGHRPYYLVAASGIGQDKEIVGVLPLVFFRSVLFGKALISVPYLNAGGVVALSGEAARSLLGKAEEIGRSLGVNYIELRYRAEDPACQDTHRVRTHKVSMELPLADQAEKLFESFPAKLRSQIRRPTKAGLYARVSGQDLSYEKSADAFYTVFSEHMRDLGTPVYPKRLLLETISRFGSSCQLITIWRGETAIAAGALIGSGTKVEIVWASALKRFNKDSPNMLLYWEAMKAAIGQGYRTFDFGRSSPDSGTYRFKAQWGATPVPLHWYYQVLTGELPDVNPNSPKFSTLVSCWQRLPLPIANLMGPWLTKSLP